MGWPPQGQRGRCRRGRLLLWPELGPAKAAAGGVRRCEDALRKPQVALHHPVGAETGEQDLFSPHARGGLVILVHVRLLNGSQVREHAQEHSLYVRLERARGAVLAAINMHLPPALPAAPRRAVVGDASAFLRTARASVKIVAGALKLGFMWLRAFLQGTATEQ